MDKRTCVTHNPASATVARRVSPEITVISVKSSILVLPAKELRVTVRGLHYSIVINENIFADELAVDFIFTFKLKADDKDNHTSEIYLYSVPYKVDSIKFFPR